jgi:hypothetical protein
MRDTRQDLETEKIERICGLLDQTHPERRSNALPQSIPILRIIAISPLVQTGIQAEEVYSVRQHPLQVASTRSNLPSNEICWPGFSLLAGTDCFAPIVSQVPLQIPRNLYRPLRIRISRAICYFVSFPRNQLLAKRRLSYTKPEIQEHEELNTEGADAPLIFRMADTASPRTPRQGPDSRWGCAVGCSCQASPAGRKTHCALIRYLFSRINLSSLAVSISFFRIYKMLCYNSLFIQKYSSSWSCEGWRCRRTNSVYFPAFCYATPCTLRCTRCTSNENK